MCVDSYVRLGGGGGSGGDGGSGGSGGSGGDGGMCECVCIWVSVPQGGVYLVRAYVQCTLRAYVGMAHTLDTHWVLLFC